MNKDIKKRITAWIALAGFVFIILNLIFFKFFIEITIGIYVIYVIYFMFVKKSIGNNDKEG